MNNVVKFLGIVAAIIVVGVGIGLLATRRPAPTYQAPEHGQAPPPGADRQNHPAPGSPSAIGKTGNVAAAPLQDPALTPSPGNSPAINLITNWEDKVDQILSGDGDEAAKAKQMLEIFPKLPADGQVEVAQHLSNLTEDANYAPLAALLANPELPEAVLEVFMADLLNRPNSSKLPLLLEVARTENHPKSPEAVEMLELFLEENHGKDWDRWQTQIQQWLKDNPD